MTRPTIAITVGDCNGIGPEVVLKSLRFRSVQRALRPILFGPSDVFQFYARKCGIPFRVAATGPDITNSIFSARAGEVPLVEPAEVPRLTISPGRLSAAAGKVALQAIQDAVSVIRSGGADALVTAPVSKRALRMAGSRVPGQTELLQRLTASRHVAMMLVSRQFKVGLATIHIPLRSVPEVLTRRLLRERIQVIHEALVRDWGISRPTLAVLGMNPHAGEGGQLGDEERRIIRPVIHSLQSAGMLVEGPFPADGFFARYTPGMYGAVVAMYHDQGLIPLKMSAGGRGVNFSAGLSIVRTSPDHGTAFDIAGQGVADPRSTVEALLLAARIALNRGSRRARRKP